MAQVVKWPTPIEPAKGEAATDGIVFAISGLTCADCAAQFEQSVRGLDGIKSAHLNMGAGKLVVRGLFHPREIIRHAERAGYQAVVVDALGKHPDGPQATLVGRLWFLALAALFLAGGVIVARTGLVWPPLLLDWLPPALTLEKTLFAVSIFYGGYHSLRGALHGLQHRLLGADFLATVIALGALVIGKWLEAAAFISLFALRETILARGLEAMRRYVRLAWGRLPESATRLLDGQEEAVPHTPTRSRRCVSCRLWPAGARRRRRRARRRDCDRDTPERDRSPSHQAGRRPRLRREHRERGLDPHQSGAPGQ